MTEVTSPMTGVVFKLPVTAGEKVEAGADVVIIESMKMHVPVPAPSPGTIKEVRVKEGDFVEEGAVLVVIA